MKKMLIISTTLLTILGGIIAAFFLVSYFSQIHHPIQKSNDQSNTPPSNTSDANTNTTNDSPANNTTTENTSPNTYITFTLNIQDFSYPEKSAALLENLITAHEDRKIPVEVFLTTTMIDEFSENYPSLWDHLTTSPMVDISYHFRPPVPYHNVAAETIDWSSMTKTEIYNLLYTYETHGLDLINGTPTNDAGSYGKLTELLGHPARCVGAAANAETAQILHSVFYDLGATCIVENENITNLGEYKEGLWVRPQHIDIKFFEEIDTPPEQILSDAEKTAINTKGAKAPYFLNVKMHDNDFFAEKSAWTTVYLAQGARRNGPPYDTSLKSPLLSEEEQTHIFNDYLALLDAAKNTDDVGILNLAGVADLLEL